MTPTDGLKERVFRGDGVELDPKTMQPLKSDPTPTDSLDSEIDILQAKLNTTPRENIKDMVCLERADIKDLIATICNEVIGTTSEVEFDTLHNEYRNGAIVRNKLRAEQRSKLQELLNGR